MNGDMSMEAHEFIRETFDLDNRTSISELPDLPISLIVEILNNYKEGKVKKLLIPRLSNNDVYVLHKNMKQT
jgi:hypothetical protein